VNAYIYEYISRFEHLAAFRKTIPWIAKKGKRRVILGKRNRL
jgi:hypothetical protein